MTRPGDVIQLKPPPDMTRYGVMRKSLTQEPSCTRHPSWKRRRRSNGPMRDGYCVPVS